MRRSLELAAMGLLMALAGRAGARAPPVATAPGAAGAAAGAAANNQPNTTSHPVPPTSYFQAVGAIYDGDYRTALEGLKSNYSLSLKTTGGGKWIDSICFLTMAGECHYRMGELPAALDNYNAAVRLALASPDWMLGIQFPSTIAPQTAGLSVPWGRSARSARPIRFPATMRLLINQALIDPIPSQSGNLTLDPPGTILSMNVQEVARCTALALKRRRELMGPVCPLDPLTASVEAVLSRRLAGAQPCVQAWWDAQAGLARLGAGESAQAIELLKRSASLPGGLDHPLTPLALVELGQLALEAGDYKSASSLLEEASYSAVAFADRGVLEEAFRSGSQAYMLAHPEGPDSFPPLAAAIPWAKNRGREVQATLLLLAAENNILLHQTAAAAGALGEARTVIGRRDMGTREIGARLNYVSAMVDYQRGRSSAGDQALADALAFERNGCKWLFQIGLADRYGSGQSDWPLTPRRALPLYTTLLRDPSGADWAADPLEAISTLTTPHPLAFEHWFELARQADVEASLEVADRLRRHRFHSTLPLGGRLMALRWVLEAPLDQLAPKAQLQRQDLLTRYPKLSELSRAARKLREELTATPLAPDSADAERKQADKLAELGRLSAEQEALLREIALRRESAEMVFPPLHKTKDVQAALLPRQYALLFFAAGDNMYAWLMSRNRLAAWRIEATPAALERRVAGLLRAIGNQDANHALSPAELADTNWRAEAGATLDALTAGSKVNLAANIDELIVVPDGPLWYLPFEALQVAKDKQAKETTALLAKCRVRYVPTMGLVVPDHRDSRPLGQMGVVLGKLHSREEPESTTGEFDRLAKIAPLVTPVKRPLAAPSPLYGSLFDTLVVLDDLGGSEKSSGASDRQPAYDWSPIQLDRTRGVGSLAGWFPLPWKNSAQIMLPGFHTPAESSLKQVVAGPRGSDLFLSTCALMSTGARTVLISRWRTGGESTHELVRHFAEELPYTSAADAWQRSVQMFWETPLDLDREPRVSRAAGLEGMTARHPLLWSGYLLIDTGWTPPQPQQIANK